MLKTLRPKRLYKYRSFNVNTLRLLSEAEVYYAKPSSFNDPLDCNPTFQFDIDWEPLEILCHTMLAAIHGKVRALEMINHERYMSSEHGDFRTDLDVQNYYMRMLGTRIKEALYCEIGKHGVLSMAERWNCPLMWSHYAEKHRGLCIEYDTTDNACNKLFPVNYKHPRNIRLSDLLAWKIKDSKDAEQVVFDTFYFAKAPNWRYEKEWRDIATDDGATSSPFRVSAIHFGLRCDQSVITTIVKLHSKSTHPVKFYSIYPFNDGFGLKRRQLDPGEIEACGLRSSVVLDMRGLLSI